MPKFHYFQSVNIKTNQNLGIVFGYFALYLMSKSLNSTKFKITLQLHILQVMKSY